MFSARRNGYTNMDAVADRIEKCDAPTMLQNKGKAQEKKSWWSSWEMKSAPASAAAPAWWPRVCPPPPRPTYTQCARAACIVTSIVLTWGTVYAVVGEAAAPGGQLLALAALVVAAYAGGWLCAHATGLPALVGMLLVGVLLQNLGLVPVASGGYVQLNTELRRVALVIILTRAGLGLDLEVMRRHYAAILKLGLLPWLVEAVAVAVATHYVMELPWMWGFLLGSMIASVSPAVVVPCLFRLRARGYGVAKGIPTLVLAAAGIDDSISVATFGIILSTMFSSGATAYNIIKGPLSILAGVAAGVGWGLLAGVMPAGSDTYVAPLRFNHVMCGGLFAVFGSNLVGWGGAGPLAVVAGGVAAAASWARRGWAVNDNPVCTVFRVLWIMFEPILFALTGAQVKFGELETAVVWRGAACLGASLALRFGATVLVGAGCGLNLREKLFIAITWMSKATVQAALGPVALELVLAGGSAGGAAEEEERCARAVLTVSLLSVVLAAPLGALLIAILGPRLLSCELPPAPPESNTAPPPLGADNTADGAASVTSYQMSTRHPDGNEIC